jgi:hypothetical protein
LNETAFGAFCSIHQNKTGMMLDVYRGAFGSPYAVFTHMAASIHNRFIVPLYEKRPVSFMSSLMSQPVRMAIVCPERNIGKILAAEVPRHYIAETLTECTVGLRISREDILAEYVHLISRCTLPDEIEAPERFPPPSEICVSVILPEILCAWSERDFRLGVGAQ